MKVKIFAVRDLKANSFNAPYVDVNEDCAKRGFAYSMNHNDLMAFQPADYQLFSVGEFDSDTGIVESSMPVLLCSGPEVMEVV